MPTYNLKTPKLEPDETFKIASPKKYKVKLTEDEIKPKSPIREKEVDFEELMIIQMKAMMEKLDKIEKENKELKEKVFEIENNQAETNDNLKYVAESIRDKTLSNEKKYEKIMKIQEEHPNSSFHINRLSSDGIARAKIGNTIQYWV